MSDLRGPIQCILPKDIAAYLGVSLKSVHAAIAAGANTWQDVYDFCNANALEPDTAAERV